jgi:methyl-accepting chemotaxis protein
MKNLPIASKFLIALLLMAVMAIGVSLYAVTNLWRTNGAYSDLLEHQAKAAVFLARANRGAGDLIGLLYKMVSQPDSTQDQEIAAGIEATRTYFHEQIAGATTALPEKRPQIDAILNAYQAMLIDYAVAEKAALDDRNAEAMALMRSKVDPATTEFRKIIMALVDDNSRTVDTRSKALTRDSRFTYDLTLGIAIGATLLVLWLAWLIARRGVSRPIETLAALMERLARGDTGIVVEGRERRDEVGAMALALQVFKEVAIEKERRDATPGRRTSGRGGPEAAGTGGGSGDRPAHRGGSPGRSELPAGPGRQGRFPPDHGRGHQPPDRHGPGRHRRHCPGGGGFGRGRCQPAHHPGLPGGLRRPEERH